MTEPDAKGGSARRGPWLWLAVVAVIGIGGMLWILATREPPPPTPNDAEHRPVFSEPGCLECHHVDGPSPQSKNHPLDQNCFRCHVRAN